MTQTSRAHGTGGSGTVTYTYDFSPTGTTNRSRLSSITYPGGKVVNYAYGATNSLNDKISRVEEIKDGSTVLERYSYLGLGTVVQRERPEHGTKLTYIAQGTGDVSADAGDPYRGLDRFGRVVDQRWRKGTDDLDRFVYTYDRNSNRLTRDVQATLAPNGYDEAYSYDSLDRLTQVQRGTLTSGVIGSVTWSQSFGLDALGNWDTVTGETGRTHNRRNQITGRNGTTWTNSVYYDNNGNLKKDERGYSFEYDAWDRLARVRDGLGNLVAEYTYDGRGYRVQRADGATGDIVDIYYDNDWRVVEERSGAVGGPGTTSATYVWGIGYIDGMIARQTTAHGRQYAQYDANYNVTSASRAPPASCRSGTCTSRTARSATRPGPGGASPPVPTGRCTCSRGCGTMRRRGRTTPDTET